MALSIIISLVGNLTYARESRDGREEMSLGDVLASGPEGGSWLCERSLKG